MDACYLFLLASRIVHGQQFYMSYTHCWTRQSSWYCSHHGPHPRECWRTRSYQQHFHWSLRHFARSRQRFCTAPPASHDHCSVLVVGAEGPSWRDLFGGSGDYNSGVAHSLHTRCWGEMPLPRVFGTGEDQGQTCTNVLLLLLPLGLPPLLTGSQRKWGLVCCHHHRNSMLKFRKPHHDWFHLHRSFQAEIQTHTILLGGFHRYCTFLVRHMPFPPPYNIGTLSLETSKDCMPRFPL